MAQIEPLDVENGLEDKENLLQHSNVLPPTPFSEKGYEEMDVSELSMKLRYSITPASSPMSKSYTPNCRDKHYEGLDDSKNISAFNSNNLTHSLNSSLKMNESFSKAGPLQPLSTELQNPVCRSVDVNPIDTAITFSFSENLNEEDSSLPSTSSSVNLTPEATTPTKEVIKDGGSPILRGLKSVFSMFRSSQSPVLTTEITPTSHTLSPTTEPSFSGNEIPQPCSISTPVTKTKESSSKRNSPLKESLTFKDDLEKELLWKEESTVFFKDEKIPIHKLFSQPPQPTQMLPSQNKVIDAGHNMSAEYMDTSQNESILDSTMREIAMGVVRDITGNYGESDGEFVDCETTFTKNDSLISSPDDESINENLERIKILQQNIERRNNRDIFETHQEHYSFDESLKLVANDVIKLLEQSANEIMEMNHNNTMEVIKNIDSSIEMLQGNQFSDNQLTVDVCVNNDTKYQEPDLESLLYANSSISVDVANSSNKEALSTLPHTNNDEESTNVNINTDSLQLMTHIGKKCRESFNNVWDHSLKECEAMDISKDNSQVIADISTLVDEKHSNITENNSEISNLDNNKQEHHDSLSEHAAVYKVDLNNSINDRNLEYDVSIVSDSQKSSDITGENVCTNNHKQIGIVINDVDKVKEASGNDTIYEKEKIECMEANTQSEMLPNKFENDNTKNRSFSNGTSDVKDSHTFDTEKENNMLSSHIPLPCDIDIEHELLTDKNNEVINSKIELSSSSNMSDFKCTEMQEELDIHKSTNQNTNDTNECDVNNAILYTAFESTNNETLIHKCEIVNQEPDKIGDKIYVSVQGDAESKPKSVSQYSNENTDDIEKSEATIDSFNTRLSINEKCDNILNGSENLKLTCSVSSESDKNTCSTMGNDIAQNRQVKMEYDEEIITSASSSPYVSVTDISVTSLNQDKDNLEKIENLFKTNSKVNMSPPISPQPSNQGYNFNFDDIQDPFATKTKIRLSPTPESPKLQSHTSSYQSKNCYSNESQSQGKDFNKNKRKSHSKNVKKYCTNTADSNKTNCNNIQKEYIQKYHNNEQSLSCNDKTLPKQNIEKNNEEANQNVNPIEVSLSTTTSFVIADEVVLKKYENEQNLSDSNKTQDSPNKEVLIDNMALAEFRNSSTAEIFDNTKGMDTTFDPEIKENENKNEIQNNNKTYESLLKEEIRTGERFCPSISFQHDDHEFNDFNSNETKKIDFDTDSNVRNDIDAIVDNVKVFPAESIIESKVKTEKNNYDKDGDVLMTDPITLTQLPIKCKVSTTSEMGVKLSSKSEENTSIIHEEAASDFNNSTCVLKNTEADHTVIEVNTEDEDTIEGPFLEGDGLTDVHNVKDFNSNSNMMQFDFPPVAEKDDNIDNGEIFIDAEAFEFLLNQNKSNFVTNSGKESLFLKFDPLYSKRMSSADVATAMSKVENSHSTPKKVAQTCDDMQTVSAEPSTSKTGTASEEYREDPDISLMSKPMMVVNPAVNPVVSPRKVTPKINRQSLTFTSPAMAVIDRLLCLSGNNSMLDQNTTFPPREHNDTDIAITQFRELLAEKEIHVHNLRLESKELKDRLGNLETQMKSLETESENRLKKINDLNECLAEKTKINRSMAVVVEEYERTIASLISEMEQEKKRNAEERNKLIKERDEQTSHLASMEVSFNDLHSKYEKSKQIILSMKANEDTYKKSIKDFEENLVKMQNNYESLKQHATSKLNHANQELEKFNKAHESEVLKLNAMIKRKEMHITSLEETLAQKTKANEELAAICDELINKVG